MEIGKKMADALNAQINAELYSSNLYLSMASYFESINLSGFSHWMKVQANEEMIHAMKMYDYVIERGGRVLLGPIDGPETEWKSPFEVFKGALKHEQMVTGLINRLVDLAIAEKDHASGNFLKWFVDEQVEEESSADDVVQKLKLMADAPGGLFMLDKELGARPPKPIDFTAIAQEAAGQ